MAEGALDVLAPDLARQLVQDLDAVAVGVADVEAVGHAVIDAAVELDTLAAQKGELLEPRLAARHRNRDMVDRNRRFEHVPIRRWGRQVRVLAESDVVVVHLPAMVAAVKAHLAVAPQRYADLLEAEDLGPEAVRFLDVPNIDHQVVDARGGQRFRRGRRYDGRCAVCHRDAPRSCQRTPPTHTIGIRAGLRQPEPDYWCARRRRQPSQSIASE